MQNSLDVFIANVLREIVNPIITLIGVGAFLYFVFGVVVFIQNAGNEEKRAEGQRHMFWGFIGMVIIFGAFGIIAVIAQTLGVDLPK